MSHDQAAVEAMATCLYPYTGVYGTKTHRDCKDTQKAASAILDAIRAGKVPTVCNLTTNEMTLQAERDALMVQINILKRSLDASREMGRKVQVDADGLRAEVERLRSELIPVGWEVLEQSGCPRCGDDVVAEPAMDGDGFLDGEPACCRSCGLPGQVVVDEESAHFSADDSRWEVEEEAKRAKMATAERDRLAGSLRSLVESFDILLGPEWPEMFHNVVKGATVGGRCLEEARKALAEVGK